MVAHPVSTAKYYKILKAFIELFTVKYNIEQLSNLWFKCFPNKDTLITVMPAKSIGIPKYLKRKA